MIYCQYHKPDAVKHVPDIITTGLLLAARLNSSNDLVKHAMYRMMCEIVQEANKKEEYPCTINCIPEKMSITITEQTNTNNKLIIHVL